MPNPYAQLAEKFGELDDFLSKHLFKKEKPTTPFLDYEMAKPTVGERPQQPGLMDALKAAGGDIADWLKDINRAMYEPAQGPWYIPPIARPIGEMMRPLAPLAEPFVTFGHGAALGAGQIGRTIQSLAPGGMPPAWMPDVPTLAPPGTAEAIQERYAKAPLPVKVLGEALTFIAFPGGESVPYDVARLGKVVGRGLVKGVKVYKATPAMARQAGFVRLGTEEADKLLAAYRTMPEEAQIAFRQAADARAAAFADDAARMNEELQAYKEGLQGDVVANFYFEEPTTTVVKGVRKATTRRTTLVDFIGKTGQFKAEWPDTITKRQAQLILQGREIKPNVLTPEGRVRWPYVMDELTQQLGFESEDALIRHVENIRTAKQKINDYTVMLEEMATERDKAIKLSETLRNLAPEKPFAMPKQKYAMPFVPKPATGMPEAGVQQAFTAEGKLTSQMVMPKGKGVVTQTEMPLAPAQIAKEPLTKPISPPMPTAPVVALEAQLKDPQYLRGRIETLERQLQSPKVSPQKKVDARIELTQMRSRLEAVEVPVAKPPVVEGVKVPMREEDLITALKAKGLDGTADKLNRNLITREEAEAQLAGKLPPPVVGEFPNPADFAAELKGKGVGRQESWSRWVQRTSLNPGMDAKDWYKIYDSVTPTAVRPPLAPVAKAAETSWNSMPSYQQAELAKSVGLTPRSGTVYWKELTPSERNILTPAVENIRAPIIPEPPPFIRRPTEPPTAPPIEPPTIPPPSGIGGAPPSPPPPSVPSIYPEGTARAINLAEAKIKQAAPGAISRALDALPLTRPIYRFFRPAPALTSAQHVAWVAKGTASSEYLTQASAARYQALEGLDKAFGPGFKTGVKANLQYTGPAERASSPLVGKAIDVLPNPDHYLLSQGQKEAVAKVGAYEREFLDKAISQYGVEIGRFPVKEGGAFIPNVDVSESALEVLGDAWTAARVGRAKTRVWEDAISRQMHTPSFKPETNLEVLMAGSDTAKGNMVANTVFKARLGGLTKLEVLEKTHPKLAGKMTALRSRLVSLRGSAGRLETKLQEAVDEFLASPIDDADLTALHSNLDVKLARGPRAGMDVAAIQKEINGVRAQIKALQPYWKAANLKPYVFVQEGVFRYFPVEEAKTLRQLLETSNNPALSLAWEVRNIAFNLDMSPITGVHLPLGFLADPIGTARQLVRVARSGTLGDLTQAGLARVVAKDPSWAEFAAVSGRPIGHTAEEFAGGILNRIPGYSKLNESMFTLVTYRTKAAWDDMVKGLVKAGIPRNEAVVVASEAVNKAVPLIDYALLGQSQARAKLLQSVTISPSFLLRPPQLMTEAAEALVKAGLKQPLTLKDKMALKVALNLAGTITTISVATAVIDAVAHKKDPGKAAIEGLTDMAIHLLDGRKIPIGGPYRSLVNAIKPKWVNREMDYMMPFVGVPKWAVGKMTPALRIQYDLIRNKDFMGRRIVTGEFPVNILETIAYEFEGAVPLSIGAWIEGWRTGAKLEKTAEEAATQLMGTSLYERPGPGSLRDDWREELRGYWAIPSNTREAQAKRMPNRLIYRKTHPDVDAKLFIVGEVETLQTIRARMIVVELMRQNRLAIEDIDGLQQKEYETAERKNLRAYFEKALGTFVPAKTPTPNLPSGIYWDEQTGHYEYDPLTK